MRFIAAAVIALVLPVAAQAADDGKYLSSEGMWRINLEKTHYPPAFNITGNDMNVTKDDGQTLQFSETVTLGGKAMTQNFDGAYDGKPHPIADGQTLTYRHVSAASYTIVRQDMDGNDREHTKCSIVAKGKAMTCHIVVLPKDGKPIKFTEHFDKVG
jgi:hypothetical protein